MNENDTITQMLGTRYKSPARLIRDKALSEFDLGVENNSPQPKKYPDGLVAVCVAATQTSRPRIYRWLRDPDRHPLEWAELCSIAEELGGSLRCMWSKKHRD